MISIRPNAEAKAQRLTSSARNTMRHFAQNECTLDVISIVEHFYEGELLNWSAFLLNELLEACEDIYKRSTNFIFGYILMTLAMWKWCPPKGRELVQIRKDQPVALR